MVFANLTYLDTLNRYIVLCSYKALLGISERSLVSTEPSFIINERIVSDNAFASLIVIKSLLAWFDLSKNNRLIYEQHKDDTFYELGKQIALIIKPLPPSLGVLK